jgi:hypothetical protein
MSSFTNIAVENVNEGFVYITDLTWSLTKVTLLTIHWIALYQFYTVLPRGPINVIICWSDSATGGN